VTALNFERESNQKGGVKIIQTWNKAMQTNKCLNNLKSPHE
jgi:hypothetical protein